MNYIKIVCNVCGVLNYFAVPVMDYKNGKEFSCGECKAHSFEVIEKDEEEII